ncbi:hypothetical protein D9M71_460440 [compost metagenome]
MKSVSGKSLIGFGYLEMMTKGFAIDAFYGHSTTVPSKVVLRPLAACMLLPIVLQCFWLWPIGQILCLTFDEWLFHSLHAPLADNTCSR